MLNAILLFYRKLQKISVQIVLLLSIPSILEVAQLLCVVRLVEAVNNWVYSSYSI